MDNPQTMAIWEHKTQNEDKQNTTKQKQSIIQKIKKYEQHRPHQKMHVYKNKTHNIRAVQDFNIRHSYMRCPQCIW